MAAAAAVPVGTEFVALLIEMKRGLHVKIEKAVFCENFKKSLQVKKDHIKGSANDVVFSCTF